jgi:hypothetical protein
MSMASRCDGVPDHLPNNLAAHLAGRSSVGKVNDELVSGLSRDRLGHELGGFPGAVMAVHFSVLVTHDPVVKTVVRNNVNCGVAIAISSSGAARIDRGSAPAP